MSRWFRFYDDALDHPKVQRLPADLFRFWVNLLCLASRSDGRIPGIEDVAFSLRVSEKVAGQNVDALIVAGLIDLDTDGVPIPHNWEARQFKSDVSTERVKQFRKRSATVSETPPDTEQIQKQKFSNENRERGREFDETFWPRYPHKVGKFTALKSFRAARKRGSLEAIMAGLENYIASKPSDRQWLNPATFLNQERWTDQPAEGINGNARAPKRTTADLARELTRVAEQREAERDDGRSFEAVSLISRAG